MEYRKLGRTGLKVSEVSLGSFLTYGNSTDNAVATAVVDRAYELGVNFFDTANVYATGEAERFLGGALAKFPRESLVLATKVFWPMGKGPNDRGLSRKHIMEQANASLKRLGMDYVDIYYCHRFDPETPVEETLRAMDDLVRQGKVLYVGISEWTGAQIEQAIRVADRYLLDRIVVNQPRYNVFQRYIESDIIPVADQYGIGQVVFSALCGGVMTGKYLTVNDIPADSRAADPKANMYMDRFLNERCLVKVRALKKLADEAGMPLARLAVAWTLRLPSVASSLLGATKISQIEENVKASGTVLGDDLLAAIEAVLADDPVKL